MLKALVFSVITFGLTMVIGFLVAALIKAIAAVIRAQERKSAENSPKQQ